MIYLPHPEFWRLERLKNRLYSKPNRPFAGKIFLGFVNKNGLMQIKEKFKKACDPEGHLLWGFLREDGVEFGASAEHTILEETRSWGSDEFFKLYIHGGMAVLTKSGFCEVKTWFENITGHVPSKFEAVEILIRELRWEQGGF